MTSVLMITGRARLEPVLGERWEGNESVGKNRTTQ